jgi:hypothetical protein
MSDIEEPPGFAERDDDPTSEQTGGGFEEDDVTPIPDEGADHDLDEDDE